MEIIKPLNDSLSGLSFGQDSEGNWGYKVGASTEITPFKSGGSLIIPSITYGRNGTRGNTYVNSSKINFDITNYKTLSIEAVSEHSMYPCTIQVDGTTVCDSSTTNFTHDITNASTLSISFTENNATSSGSTTITNLVCE